MSSLTWNLNQLEIIGYTDRIPPDCLPDIVSPIYRPRGKSEPLLIPPYNQQKDQITVSNLYPSTELNRLMNGGRATDLYPAIPAKEGYLLWIDLRYQPRYQPPDEAARNLKRISAEHIQEARKALGQREYRKAAGLAQTAFCADTASWDALLLRAAAWWVLGEHEDQIRTLTHIAKDIDPSRDFLAETEQLAREFS